MNNNNNKQLVNVNEMQEKNVMFDSITQAGIKYFFNDTACSGCRNKLINSLFIQEFSFMDNNNQELQTKSNFNNYIQTEFRKLAEDLFDFITIYGIGVIAFNLTQNNEINFFVPKPGSFRVTYTTVNYKKYYKLYLNQANTSFLNMYDQDPVPAFIFDNIFGFTEEDTPPHSPMRTANKYLVHKEVFMKNNMAADIELSLPHVFVAQENKDTQNNTMNADDFPIMNENINQFDNFNTFQDVLQGPEKFQQNLLQRNDEAKRRMELNNSVIHNDININFADDKEQYRKIVDMPPGKVLEKQIMPDRRRDFLDLIRFLDENICISLGVPRASLISDYSQAVKGNLSEINESLKNCIKRYQFIIEQMLTKVYNFTFEFEKAKQAIKNVKMFPFINWQAELPRNIKIALNTEIRATLEHVITMHKLGIINFETFGKMCSNMFNMSQNSIQTKQQEINKMALFEQIKGQEDSQTLNQSNHKESKDMTD